MNYELAKELKEAGFPLREATKREQEDWAHHKPFVDGIVLDYVLYHLPTLSELIEACGDKFGGLVQEIAGGWRAYDANIEIVDGRGSTPTEAIKRLWLALHAKK